MSFTGYSGLHVKSFLEAENQYGEGLIPVGNSPVDF